MGAAAIIKPEVDDVKNCLQITARTVASVDWHQYQVLLLFLTREDLAQPEKLPYPAEMKKMLAYIAQMNPEADRAGNVLSFPVALQGKLQQVILTGLGSRSALKAKTIRDAAGEAVRAVPKPAWEKLLVLIAAPVLEEEDAAFFLQALAEGLTLGSYVYRVYKTNPSKTPLLEVTVLTRVPEAARLLREAVIVAEAVNFTRDLCNEPGNKLTPADLAERAALVARERGLELEILTEEELARKKMQAILAVGQGSVHGPRMITLRYHGGADKPYLALVGKGITFDSGGISIKPDDNMGEMKDDMSGAGAVLGALQAIAALKLPCNVLGIMACAENMPSGSAQRPGDIVRAASGKTIEVISTDAEGRMVLADGVWYACEQGAAQVVDIATLTGAVIVALGKNTSGIISNNDALAARIRECGRQAGESWWQLPSLPECAEAIKSEVADVKNSAGRAGSCITGGLFIGSFIKENIPWAHLDIGGTSTAGETKGALVKGCTGFGTATLIALARSLV